MSNNQNNNIKMSTISSLQASSECNQIDTITLDNSPQQMSNIIKTKLINLAQYSPNANLIDNVKENLKPIEFHGLHYLSNLKTFNILIFNNFDDEIESCMLDATNMQNNDGFVNPKLTSNIKSKETVVVEIPLDNAIIHVKERYEIQLTYKTVNGLTYKTISYATIDFGNIAFFELSDIV